MGPPRRPFRYWTFASDGFASGFCRIVAGCSRTADGFSDTLRTVKTTLIALHGFTMNAAGLRHMMSDLEPRLGAAVDLEFVDAPQRASADSVAGLSGLLGGLRPRPPNLQWWNASDDGLTYAGWNETRARLEETVRGRAAAGLLGFSQGAAVAASLAAAASRGEFPSLAFVVLIAGFTPRAIDIAPLFADPVRVPSLHVWGEADPFARHAPALYQRFDPATREMVTWPGRHLVPTTGDEFEVRYWKPSELRRVFGRIGPTELSTDGFFTLNPQKRDLDLLPPRFRALVRVSETLKRAHTPTTLADSVNIRSVAA